MHAEVAPKNCTKMVIDGKVQFLGISMHPLEAKSILRLANFECYNSLYLLIGNCGNLLNPRSKFSFRRDLKYVNLSKHIFNLLKTMGWIFSIIPLAASSWFGFELISIFLSNFFDCITRTAMGIPVGIFIYAWSIFIVNLYASFSYKLGFISISIILVLALLIRIIRPKGKTPKPGNTFLWIITAGMPALYLAFLMIISLLFKGRITRGAVYGDLPFHLNIISSFVYGCNRDRKYLFDIVSPFFAKEPLAYPVMVNYLSSLLIGCFGASLEASILLPSLPMSFSIFTLLAQITHTFSKNLSARMLSPWIFMFLGGIGILSIFDPEALKDQNADYVHIWGNDRYGYWLQTTAHVLLPQRLSLFSLPIIWSFVLIFLKIDFDSILPFFGAGIIVAVLPQVHAHSLIAAVEYLFAWALIRFPFTQPKKWVRQILCYAALGSIALGFGIPQLLPYIKRANGDGFFQTVPIWKDDNLNFFSIWWRGLGTFWFISIIMCPFIISRRQLRLYAPSLFVFVISNLVHYQPWNMDNSKVFYAGWISAACALVAHILSWIVHDQRRFFSSVGIVLLVSTIASGFVCNVKLVAFGYDLWNQDDTPFEFAEKVRRLTDPKGIFATDSFHEHPVATLAGRQLLVGYRGWMPSHNLDDRERVMYIRTLCEEPDDTDWLDRMGVKYAVYHTSTHDEMYADISGAERWDLLINISTWRVYKRNSLDMPE